MPNAQVKVETCLSFASRRGLSSETPILILSETKIFGQRVKSGSGRPIMLTNSADSRWMIAGYLGHPLALLPRRKNRNKNNESGQNRAWEYRSGYGNDYDSADRVIQMYVH